MCSAATNRSGESGVNVIFRHTSVAAGVRNDQLSETIENPVNF